MMNHFKAFLLFFSLALVNTGLAAPNFEKTSPAFGGNGESAWVLPAPTSVFLLSVGTTWSNISWTAVPGAAGYRIITTIVATGAVVNNTVVSAAMSSAQLEPLPAGTTLLSTVYAIDQFGMDGQGRGVQYDTIIIETVGKFTAPNGYYFSVCTVPISAGNQDGCMISWNGSITYFEISYGEYVGIFKTEKINESKMRLRHDINSDFGFVQETSGISKVTFNGSDVARIACLKNIGNGNVSLLRKGTDGNMSNVQIKKIIYQDPLSSELDDRNFETVMEIDLTPRLVATPNPFSDQLEIQIPFATPENELHMALYDLQGRMMITQNIANGGPIQTIETGTLPTGVYILRVECGGKAETIKVVKTQ